MDNRQYVYIFFSFFVQDLQGLWGDNFIMPNMPTADNDTPETVYLTETREWFFWFWMLNAMDIISWIKMLFYFYYILKYKVGHMRIYKFLSHIEHPFFFSPQRF